MIKKLMTLGILGTNLLLADYYTSVDARLNGIKQIQYQDGVVLNIGKGIYLGKNYKFLFDSDKPIKYKNIVLQKKVKVVDPKIGKKVDTIQSFSYSTYNFAYLLKYNLQGEFIITTPKVIFVVKTKTTKDKIKVFNKKYDVYIYTYEIEESYNSKDFTPINLNKKILLKKYVDINGNLLAIEIFDSGVKKIKRVVDNNLKIFLKENKKRKTVVDSFKYDNEKLYLSYISNIDSKIQRLNVEYSKVKKKYTKVILSSPVSLLDPETKSDLIIQNVGFLIPARGKLWEVKKVQIVNNDVEESWKNTPKSSKLVIVYKNGTTEERNIVFKKKGQLFYGFEGIFYLVSWMNQNNKDKVVFSFVNGPIVFDATMQKDGKDYVMTKRGNVIYRFKIDNKGFIERIDYPSYDLVIKLDSVETDSTIKNKKFLEQFQKAHHIKLIKE